MTTIALKQGHTYQAALDLSFLERAASGALESGAEGKGFSAVAIYTNVTDVPAAFGHLIDPSYVQASGANAWAEGTWAKDDQSFDLPSQVLAVQENGSNIATGSASGGLAAGDLTAIVVGGASVLAGAAVVAWRWFAGRWPWEDA